jgi:starch-binding outer membrane protein, SusD/RagB family
MKKIIIFSIFSFVICNFSCKKKLDIQPIGILSQEQIARVENLDKMVTSAYSTLGNGDINVSMSLWQFGDVLSDDSYKGGRAEDDGADLHNMEVFVGTLPTFFQLNDHWREAYIGINRTNAALRLLNAVSETQFPLKKNRQGEMRFLRGFYYSVLKLIYRNIPYVDENIAVEDIANLSNRQFTSEQLWDKIAADFQFAADNLPATQSEKGRPTQAAANGYLAKVRLYQAYTQDDNYNVTGINASRMQQVVESANKVIASSFRLESDFANNFLPGAFENGSESLFAIQFSQNDGTLLGRLNYGDALNVPQGLGCCDFHKPSQNLVNSFRTDANGLPLLDNFNDQDLNLSTNTVDPRLGHTVAIPGQGWKYEPKKRIFQTSWSRNPGVYGTYASLKENVSPDCGCFFITGAFRPNSKNKILLRYADVLLMKAEALVELGRQDEALPIINQLRTRAAQSTALLKDANDNPNANYLIGTYQPGVNIIWNQATARKAVRFERRLEMAMESSRFFDLVRWGIAEPTLNSYFAKEKLKRSFLNNARFEKNKNEYLPIPQGQMNLSKGNYIQNIGYN